MTESNDTIIVRGRSYPVPPNMAPEQYRTVVEWQIDQGMPPATVIATPPSPVYAPTDLKKVSVLPGIEQNLLLWQVFLEAFNARDWSELKGRFVRDDQGEVQLIPLSNDLADGEELRSTVEAVVGYERRIQRAVPEFAYTDYQFIAILFAELFFLRYDHILDRVRTLAPSYPKLRLYSGQPPADSTELENWLVSRLDALQEPIRTKSGFTKSFEKKLATLVAGIASGKPANKLLAEKFELTPLDEYLSGLNRMAFYLATGSGKTHLLHVNLMQAESHLRQRMRLEPTRKLNFYLVAPNNELAAQHARELKKCFPEKEIGFVEDGADKTVTESTLRLLQGRADVKVLTTHQLNEVMKRTSDGLFGVTSPFGEANVVFADEGHKGADKDTGWRDDRNRLMGVRGFCFEYSATFSQSIKQKNPLIQEYAKAIIFDYPYRLFYQDGYGKKPVFFPQDKAGNIAGALLSGKENADLKWELTQEDRWRLFVEQMGRFHEQVSTYHGHATTNDDYRLHKFYAPLMLMMGNRVDDKNGASHIREVLTMLERFMANEKDESVTMLATVGRTPARKVFQELFQRVFHAEKPVGLDVRRINDQELGLKAAGSSRYFGVVYVGTADAVGWQHVELDRLTGSLMEAFFERGDHPDVNFIVAARKLVEGWNTFRISSLGLVELGKSRGSLVVQLFGRGVRLSGTPERRLKRTGRFPVSERFDVFGYEAAYLRTFIDEAEAAGIVTERTLDIRIDLKDGEPKGRHVPMPSRTFAESGRIVHLATDERFLKILKRHGQPAEAGAIRCDPRPLLDWQKLYRDVSGSRNEPNFVLHGDSFITCGSLALKEIALPAMARISDRDFFHRWAVGRMNSLLAAYWRDHSQEYEFEHAELTEITAETSRNLNFGRYQVSGPAEVIEEIEQALIQAGAIKDEAFHQYGTYKAEVARLSDGEIIAVKSKPHLFEPLLVRLANRDDIRISPDRLEPSEFKFVSVLHDYALAHPKEDIALLRNQKAWGFLGYYPDFVLWYRKKGIEHIAFIDPKGLMLHNTFDVVEKLSFSLALGDIEQRLRKTSPKVRLTSFILLNQRISDYLADTSQQILLIEAFKKRLQDVTGMKTDHLAQESLPELFSLLNARETDSDMAGLLAAIVTDDYKEKKVRLMKLLKQHP